MIKNYLNSGKPMFGKIELRKDESLKYCPSIKKSKKFNKLKPLIKFEKWNN